MGLVVSPCQSPPISHIPAAGVTLGSRAPDGRSRPGMYDAEWTSLLS